MTNSRIKLLLDTNCLFDVSDSERSQRNSVLELVGYHNNIDCVISLNAISASENPKKSGTHLLKFADFEHWIEGLSLGHLPILPPLFVWGVTFWNQGLMGGSNENALFQSVHDLIFPKFQLNWQNEALTQNTDVSSKTTKVYRDWVNRHCDVQMAWTAIHFDQDILVTSNTKDFQTNFYELSQLGLKAILRPNEAVEYIRKQRNLAQL